MIGGRDDSGLIEGVADLVEALERVGHRARLDGSRRPAGVRSLRYSTRRPLPSGELRGRRIVGWPVASATTAPEGSTMTGLDPAPGSPERRVTRAAGESVAAPRRSAASSARPVRRDTRAAGGRRAARSIMSWRRRRVSGCSRNDVSARTSTSTPPVPQAISGPNEWIVHRADDHLDAPGQHPLDEHRGHVGAEPTREVLDRRYAEVRWRREVRARRPAARSCAAASGRAP